MLVNKTENVERNSFKHNNRIESFSDFLWEYLFKYSLRMA